jgi:hypothetical protein
MTVLTRVGPAAFALAAMLVLCAARAAEPQAARENEVKATFLLKFTNFVDWPTSSFSDPAAPFRICVVGDAGLSRAVDRVIQGEKVRGHPVRRAALLVQDDPARCQILYVGRQETDRAGALIAAVHDAPVLTVGDTTRFVRKGGAIGFVLENKRVRFDVNLRAAERSGLIVSSRLLRVARHVEPDGR